MAFQKLSSEILREHKGKSFPGISTAFIYHDGKGNILLAKRSENARDENGRWDAGGGGLKFGQSIEENLLREIKEEYNFTPKSIEFLGYSDAFRTGSDGVPTHWLALYFAALVDPDEFNINEPDMVSDAGWFTLDTLPKPMHSMFPAFMEKHGDALRKSMNKSVK